MHEQICPFERVIFSTTFSCTESHKYFFAEKEGISCKNPSARLQCILLTDLLRRNSQFALHQQAEASGKLTHGQEMKLSCGGLQGLETVIGEQADIHSLVNAAIEQYSSLDALPWDRIIPSVQAYRIRKGGITR
jgi:hypothetical protein